MKYHICLLSATSCFLFAMLSGVNVVAKTWNDVDVSSAATNSQLYGSINKIQAAELLQKIILEGQQRKVMLKYVGIDPRILATVHIDQIDIRFRKFDQFSETPVGWSREGALMNDFKAKWASVTNVSCAYIENDSDMNYYGISLYKENGAAMTFIPLHVQPAGYTIKDALLAALLLQGTLKSAATTSRDLPAPPKPTATPAISAESVSIPENDEQSPSSTPKATATAKATMTPAKKPVVIPTITPAPILPTAPPIENDQPLSIRQKLETLKQLHQEGLIDREVYLEKQRAIIDEL